MRLIKQIGSITVKKTPVLIPEEMIVEWKIKYVRSLSDLKDEFWESPDFYFVNSNWCLQLYPSGFSKNIAVSLHRREYGPPKTIKFTFGIECFFNEVKEKIERECEFSGKCVTNGVVFYPRTDMNSEDRPPGMAGVISMPAVRIICRLKNIEDAKVSFRRTMLGMSCNMKRALTDGKWSDFNLKMGNREWPVHKAILECRSKYFANLFQHDWIENTEGELTLEDIDEGTMNSVLSFIYTGCVEDMSVKNVYEICLLAYKFFLDDLKDLCVEFMKENMCLEIVCKALVIVDKYEEGKLYHSAFEYFLQEEYKILESEEWKELKKNHGSVAADIMEETRKKRDANQRFILVFFITLMILFIYFLYFLHDFLQELPILKDAFRCY